MRMRTKNELFNQDLPKWPQLIVTGQPVAEDEALEIIRRTDSFFHEGWGGNNHKFDREVRELVNYPQSEDFNTGNQFDDFDEYCKAHTKWLENWQYIETEYITNDWVSCCFIGGPHGWMHPDGVIGYNDNIGKWPTIKEVYDEFSKIAEAFPFLDMEATLMSAEREEANSEPVISFKIKGGKVKAVDPKCQDVHRGKQVTRYRREISPIDMLTNVCNENAISISVIEKWADKYC